MKTNTKQLRLLQDQPLAHGGELFTTRAARARHRPLDTRNTMHLVLRSRKAVGPWSFKSPKNERAIGQIVQKFSRKYGVKICSMANVGNHLHFQIKLSRRFGYKPFIRAITSAIAMAVTGKNRWSEEKSEAKLKFWDYRPFTRVVQSYRGFLKLKDYIEINRLEGFGLNRGQAKFMWLKLNNPKGVG